MTLSRLFAIAAVHRRRLLAGLLFMLMASAASLAIPWIGGQVAGGLFGEIASSFGVLILGLFGLFALRTALQIAQDIVLSRATQHIMAALKRDLYAHLQLLPLSFYQERSHGDVISLIGREVEMLTDFVTGPLLALVPMLLTLAGALVLMMHLDPILALPVIAGIPIFFVLVKLVGRRLRPLATELRTAYSASLSLAEANLATLPAIKSYTREPLEAGRFDQRVGHVRDIGVRLAQVQAVIGPLMHLGVTAFLLMLVWLGRDRIGAGGMGPGELVAFLLYAMLLTRPVSALADSWGAFQHARGALANLDEVLNSAPEEDTGRLAPERIAGAVRLENVHFGHQGRTPVLRDLSLEIPAGEMLALTGENGAGKSTLIELLMRFHEPESGRVLLDGEDVRDYRLVTLRRAIALVPQQVMLCDGTVAENIRFGNPDATDAEVAIAAERAQAAGFIAALPQSYETRIGDRGLRLSGGQRQRIALARALLKDPAILVLDEPTAMFDPEGESAFVETARSAFAGKTVILITHRPASLALADRIVRLKDGRIVEEERRIFPGAGPAARRSAV